MKTLKLIELISENFFKTNLEKDIVHSTTDGCLSRNCVNKANSFTNIHGKIKERITIIIKKT